MKYPCSLVTVVAAFALVACHSKKETATELLPPAAVRVVAVMNKARTANEEVVGTVQPKLRAGLDSQPSHLGLVRIGQILSFVFWCRNRDESNDA
jgi:uncharacterized lipoprotein YbaY